jgi:hypothetical protein
MQNCIDITNCPTFQLLPSRIVRPAYVIFIVLQAVGAPNCTYCLQKMTMFALHGIQDWSIDLLTFVFVILGVNKLKGSFQL